jgi:hypothetical protein
MAKSSDDKDQRWKRSVMTKISDGKDQSKWNKVSSGGEVAFLIVGSHLQFPMTDRSSVDRDC